ncbi:cobalamin-dependent protein [Halanaerobium sp. Z-7514]|uniref:Cobalamin-dependent protein n=1 Tax=Halanaerobium polyolivorans TaxID=2886943 RepID=A0AAW4WZ62_9FIRM|nr:cobalamin-dependent protein [Halanaerobium polyolivorans]MCC3145157.1 cobalamin-dependent protein [Halanaerobium polyolivorans]
MAKTIYDNLAELPVITADAAAEYKEKKEILTETVNEQLSSRNDIFELIGHNPISKMQNNHDNHARFMANIFKLNDYKLLLRTVIWVYMTYHSHDFSFDYFSVELKAWIEAIEEKLSSESAGQIIEIYNFMLDNHQNFIELSKEIDNAQIDIPADMETTYNLFFKYLLNGDHKKALMLAKEEIEEKEDLQIFFNHIIKPAMYEVGFLWQKGAISEAEEHLASSIVARVISGLYIYIIDLVENSKGKAVISAAANEYHEIGSRIIADSLEMDGWDVEHLGADTPVEALIDFLKMQQPTLLGLSVSMAFNLDNLNETIAKIKSKPELKDLKIMVGGKIFNENPELWKKTGADTWAKDGEEAVEIAKKWWEKKEG